MTVKYSAAAMNQLCPRVTQAEMDEYEFASRLAGLGAGADSRQVRLLHNMRMSVHRLYRETGPGRLLEAVAEVASGYVSPPLPLAVVAGVAAASIGAAGRTLTQDEAERLYGLIAARVRPAGLAKPAEPDCEIKSESREQGKEKVMEKDEVRDQSAEGTSQSDEGTRNEATMNEGTAPEEQALVLKPSELAAKVQEFLATRLENPADAEPFAKDIAGAVVQGTTPVTTPSRHKPQRRGRPATSELSAAGVTGQSTPTERFTRRGATDALRAALSGHQDVVKFVVAGRLCAKKTFDELAQEYGLTKDEVLDIITRMRAWVSRFTTYFDNEWYWKEGMGKYFIPAPPLIVPGGAK
jgi:hypothetical protein